MALTPFVPTRRIDISAKTFLFAAVTVGACWVFLHLIPVLLSVVVALFLVGTLTPAVDWLEKRKIKRGWGIAGVFLAMATVTVSLLVLTVPALVGQVKEMADREPEVRNRLADLLGGSPITASLGRSLRHVKYDAMAQSFAGEAFELSTRAIEIGAYFFSSVFLALYIMVDRDRLRGGLFAMVPRQYHVRMGRVMINLETIIGGYIRGQVLTSALMAVFVFVLLTICGVPNAVAIAVFAGIADVLPYVGPILSVGSAALAAIAKGPAVVIVVVGVMVAYEELESRVLVPKIYGRALRLPSSIVLLSLLAGGTLMGILGALIALPVAAAIRMLVEELRVVLPGEDVDDSVVRERDDRAERQYERKAEGVPAEQAAAIAVAIADKRLQEEGPRSEAAEVPITAGRSS